MDLKKDLDRQKLPIPKDLSGADKQKFIRKRLFSDSPIPGMRDFMMSPERSPSPFAHQRNSKVGKAIF